ncbi:MULTISPECIES: peptide-methionine (S)-S-oxide reductase MsrA [unclassified Ensifer]|uniref:peptide-methionine (S)-S-oxide reductase MsrA n=1 Tax=unclassified Ensifer TaxID=2633371 RepID=UPI000813CF4C|nr:MULTISPECIES: peptide-methionine (S)-S-oxide reductase MsrA [unclassified Ensifer]OCO98822.1 peptide-methionine (S)-S-oxide reductase [Ensifer sp. LC14]OCP13302.1 peptide-methionine (S)-S-oxide reductase [Ensifer sp. LC13]OCP13905.1 peptide-methionine (S)-S-oxide reductase [Ensifer sp. LC11]OCP28284.1 peptide-methionine (S)-S-oxide reductase [Ensifer sp. LC499]
MFLIDMFNKKTIMPDAQTALPGRQEAIPTAETHFVSGRLLKGPYPDGTRTILFGMGCFWGAERLLWNIQGVHVTAVGYAGGLTPNPTYQETTTGLTGHAEVVLVVYEPQKVPLAVLLKTFFEEHDPTQGMRQGNDIGTTYRSAIYAYDDEQLAEAKAARTAFQAALKYSNHGGKITTEISKAGPFYFAEDYHQQYLAKNPNGYCGLRGTGVSCPIGH